MSNLSRFASIATIASSSYVFQIARDLEHKENRTPQEEEALKAYRRTLIGSIVVVISAMLMLAIVVVFNLPDSDTSVRRTGTVLEEGQVQYIQDTEQYITLSELGLQDLDLQEGDKVIIFFDNLSDEIVSAYAKEAYEQKEESQILTIVFAMLLAVTIILGYVVIARTTKFGRPWTRYCKAIKAQEEPVWTESENKVVTVIAVLLALLLCSGEIYALAQHVKQLQE